MSIGPEPDRPVDHGIELVSLRERVVALHRERFEALRERDEARRDYVQAIRNDYGGMHMSIAAKRWGRDAALHLYPHERLLDVYAIEHGWPAGYAEILPDCGLAREDIEEDAVTDRAEFDREFPPTDPNADA